MIVTHAVQFADEASAKTALPEYWLTSTNPDGTTGWSWRRDIVDGPIPTTHKTGNMVPVLDESGNPTGAMQPERVADTTYSLNIGLTTLNASMPGLLAAWDGTGASLLDGVLPKTPQRVFQG